MLQASQFDAKLSIASNPEAVLASKTVLSPLISHRRLTDLLALPTLTGREISNSIDLFFQRRSMAGRGGVYQMAPVG